MKRPLKILILEDSATDAEMVQRVLLKEQRDFSFRVATSKKDFLETLEAFHPDIILSDHSLPQFDSEAALKLTREHFPHLPFILVTGTVSEEYAANIIKMGADDYILKDRLARLPAAIDTAMAQRRIQKEIADYKYALDQAADMTITDQKGIIIYANNNFCKISGYSPDELLGQDHRLVNSGHHPASFIKNLWVTIANGDIWHGEFRNKAKNGTFYWEDTTVVPFLDNRGKPYQYLAIRKDITQRKLIEGQLLKSEEKYRTIFLKSPLPNWIYDVETLFFVDVNEAAVRHYGYSREEFLSMKILDIRPKEDEELLLVDLTLINAGQDSRHGFWRHRKKNGELINVETTAHSIEYNGRKARLVIANDVTKKMEAEEEVRKSHERFQYAMKASSDIIWELNFETKQYMLYEGKEKLFGTQVVVDWALGTEGTYIVEEDRENVRSSFSEARKDPGQTIWTMEYRVYSATRSILHIINHAYFIRDGNGKVVRAIGAITDITDRKNLEEELLEQQRQGQLKIIATSLEAQEKERTAIGQELHDNVNQILVAANMMLSMIKTQPERSSEMIETTKGYLQQAISENRKIAHVFVAPDLKTESLADQLQRLVHNMLGTAGLGTQVVTDQFREEKLDSARKINIYRIAQEQCTNIIKYSLATAVRLELINSEEGFRMIIADNGVGMDETKKSTGIGLRNINGRLSLFNGNSRIITAPGKGFTLEISMPLAK